MASRRGFFAAAAIALAAAAGAADASIVHFSNGRQIWTSLNSGASFVNSGAVTTKVGGSGTALSNLGIVGLGYYSGNNTFYATGSDGWLYSVSGLGSASVTITGAKDLNGSTISFDFFGSTLRAARGNDLIEVDMNNLAAPVNVLNANTGHSFPSTANVSGTYYGITNDGSGANFYRINSAGLASFIGQTFATDMNMAGGASLNGVYYTTAHISGNTLFGSVNVNDGSFTQISSTAMASVGQMGMVVVIPLPPAAMAGMASLAGLGGLAWVRRRKLAQA